MKDEYKLIHTNTPVAAEAIVSLSEMEEIWAADDQEAFADLIAHKVLELLISNTNITQIITEE
jgi:hypothetical protein